MKIVECKIQVFGKRIHLHLIEESGRTSTGEIAPLLSYSKETFDEAFAQLNSLVPFLLNMRDWKTLYTKTLFPSVYFGVESALLDLINPIDSTQVTSYALLMGTEDEIKKRALIAMEEGYKEAKVKLGDFTIEKAHQIISYLKEKFKLRLDLNRRWSLKQSLTFFSHYPKEFFHYVEEPVMDPADLIHFPYPFALDETLREKRPLIHLLGLSNFKAAILKPTLLYPLPSFPAQKIVITSSFEGTIGISQIKKLIARLGLSSTLHGLDTLRYTEV